jgi:hypothetical protein
MHWLTKKIAITLCCLALLLPACVYGGAAQPIIDAQWQQLKADKAFDYAKSIEGTDLPKDYKPGLLQKVIVGLFNFLSSPGGTVLLWLMIIGMTIYFISVLFFNKDSFLFARKNKAIKEAKTEEVDDEDVAGTNWEQLLKQANANNDLRLAVRYAYMWLLQILQQHELIKYRNDKTNVEYAMELSGTQYKQVFNQLSRQYEYTWYGRARVDAAAFNGFMAAFDNVKKQIGA